MMSVDSPTAPETIRELPATDLQEVSRRFDQAILAYKAQADPLNLLLLNKSAIPLMDAQAKAWKSVDDPEALSPERPFAALRVLCDRRLRPEEISRLSGCLGYAFQATLAGPELSPPDVSWMEATGRAGVAATFTLLVFAYDARLSTRTTPDYAEAFAKAREYIREGTPVISGKARPSAPPTAPGAARKGRASLKASGPRASASTFGDGQLPMTASHDQCLCIGHFSLILFGHSSALSSAR